MWQIVSSFKFILKNTLDYNNNMQEKVFDRVEKKYLVVARDKAELVKIIGDNLKKDTYHKSEVFNIYFDNDNFDLITQSIDWTDFKEKIRARSYGGYDRVFVEIKTKIRGKDNNIGYKRRVMITKSDYEEFVSGRQNLQALSQKSIETVDDLQIAKEADYLIKKLDLKPKILVVYDRESYKDSDGLRITFDENLRYRDQNLSFVKANDDKIYFEGDHNIIMEIKASGALPLWLVKKMSELKLYPQQFSKIGNIYKKLRKDHNV